MPEKTYTVTVICDNCGQQNSIEVPKGILKNDAIKKQQAPCDNCGCFISQPIAAADTFVAADAKSV